jgi:hypothetical protein
LRILACGVRMEVYDSLSRVLLRRKYRRVEGGGSGFAVKRRRVKVAHLQQDDEGARRRSTAHRFRLRFLLPGKLVASLKVACVKLVQQVAGKGTKAIEPPPPVPVLPKTMALRASCGDVVNEAWFQHALRRSIAEGRLAVETNSLTCSA